MAEIHRLHAVVSGDVQGVGFRWFAERSAGRLGLAGWVKNLPDGTVEVEAEGPKRELEELLKELRKGPYGSHVVSVQADWLTAAGLTGNFQIR